VCVLLAVELEFQRNPFLVSAPAGGGGGGGGGSADAAVVLAKAYSFEPAGNGGRMLTSHVVAAPQWGACDPTHKAARGRQRPAASIFQLFKPGGGKLAFNLSGDARDVQVGGVRGGASCTAHVSRQQANASRDASLHAIAG
jgi:hypothetical protein